MIDGFRFITPKPLGSVWMQEPRIPTVGVWGAVGLEGGGLEGGGLEGGESFHWFSSIILKSKSDRMSEDVLNER